MIDEKNIIESAIQNADKYNPCRSTLDVEEACRASFKDGIEWFTNAIWHDASEEPESDKFILIRFVDYKGNVEYGTDILALPITWNNWVEICKITKWCYVEDLLPKGGEE